MRNAEPKVQLIQALEAYPSEDVRVAVEPFLGDMSEPVRFTSATTLFAINDPQSLPALVAVLETDESRRIQNRIAQGLADRSWLIPSDLADQLKKAETQAQLVGQSTENGIWLFWDKAIKEKQHWDHVFVYSDMQAGHGGLYGSSATAYDAYRWHGTRNIDVAKLVSEYRRQVNPNVMVYLVQVAGYQDTIIPEHYVRTAIIGGWSEGLLRFAKFYETLFNKAQQ